MEMGKEEIGEKTELDNIVKFMDYVEYFVFTKDNIRLKCCLRRERYSVQPNTTNWEGEIRWVLSESVGDLAGHSEVVYMTNGPFDLEHCVKLMNDFIRDNFKTRLD